VWPPRNPIRRPVLQELCAATRTDAIGDRGLRTALIEADATLASRGEGEDERYGQINSDIELVSEILGTDPEENPNYQHYDDEADDPRYNTLEESEGWDGRPLPDEELWETTVNGFRGCRRF
jgi:hypothetical protein